MLRNHMSVGLRALYRDPLFTLINLVGLAIGLAACLMIVLFIRRTLHRPIPSHRRLTRPDQRITIRPRHVLEEIFREKLTIDFYVQPIFELRDLNALRGRAAVRRHHFRDGGQGC